MLQRAQALAAKCEEGFLLRRTEIVNIRKMVFECFKVLATYGQQKRIAQVIEHCSLVEKCCVFGTGSSVRGWDEYLGAGLGEQSPVAYFPRR